MAGSLTALFVLVRMVRLPSAVQSSSAMHQPPWAGMMAYAFLSLCLPNEHSNNDARKASNTHQTTSSLHGAYRLATVFDTAWRCGLHNWKSFWDGCIVAGHEWLVQLLLTNVLWVARLHRVGSWRRQLAWLCQTRLH